MGYSVGVAVFEGITEQIEHNSAHVAAHVLEARQLAEIHFDAGISRQHLGPQALQYFCSQV